MGGPYDPVPAVLAKREQAGSHYCRTQLSAQQAMLKRLGFLC
jgi:hypothetical protein